MSSIRLLCGMATLTIVLLANLGFSSVEGISRDRLRQCWNPNAGNPKVATG